MEAVNALVQRALQPIVIGWFAYRGDPLASLVRGRGNDPYQTYSQARERGVYKSPVGAYIASRHQDVEQVLRGSGWVKSLTPRDDGPAEASSAVPHDRDLLLNMDPPDHTRLRRLLAPMFSPPAIGHIRPIVRRIVEDHFDGVDPRGVEVISELAYPIPTRVICELLGAPLDDSQRLWNWGVALAASLDPLVSSQTARRRDVAMHEVSSYFDTLIAHRRAGEPGNAIIDALIAAEDDGDRLSARELLATCVLLLIAGFETTVNLIGNGTLALLRHGDQFAALQNDCTLVPRAVEEMLRFESPVQATMRLAATEHELGGVAVPLGAPMITLLGAANHDESRFPDAHKFDILRTIAERHVSFGSGIHHCLGAALARLEAEVFFEVLAERAGSLEARGRRPTYRKLMVLRGLEHLGIAFA